jgi:hypothetical protein
MNLKCVNENVAGTFGLPQRDCTSDEIIAQLTEQGYTPTQAQNHLDCAIASGAYVNADSEYKEYKSNEEKIVKARKPRQGVEQ